MTASRGLGFARTLVIAALALASASGASAAIRLITIAGHIDDPRYSDGHSLTGNYVAKFILNTAKGGSDYGFQHYGVSPNSPVTLDSFTISGFDARPYGPTPTTLGLADLDHNVLVGVPGGPSWDDYLTVGVEGVFRTYYTSPLTGEIDPEQGLYFSLGAFAIAPDLGDSFNVLPTTAAYVGFELKTWIIMPQQVEHIVNIVNQTDFVSSGPGVVQISSVPEPQAWGLLILGLAGVGAALRRRLQQQAVGPAVG